MVHPHNMIDKTAMDNNVFFTIQILKLLKAQDIINRVKYYALSHALWHLKKRVVMSSDNPSGRYLKILITVKLPAVTLVTKRGIIDPST